MYVDLCIYVYVHIKYIFLYNIVSFIIYSYIFVYVYLVTEAMQKWRKMTGKEKQGKKKGIYVETCICGLDLCILIYIELCMP
jgi:hypothetical protein